MTVSEAVEREELRRSTRARFHELTVAAVEPLCDDAVAVTFDVPEGLRDAYDFAAKENIQTHGGMGFTWEFDCHLHYRRAKLLGLMLGGVPRWKDLLISRIEARAEQHAASILRP